MAAGLLLAAGAGRRYGLPKALAEDGAWLRRSVAALGDGGCDPVLVVLGAEAHRATPLVPAPARTVVAEDWREGMGASLRAGLSALGAAKGTFTVPGAAKVPLAAAAEAALIHLVDLPDVGAAVIARVAALAAPDAVARATFDGQPGHPVLLGRAHWTDVCSSLSGDRGARQWLAACSDLVTVECADLATGADRDRR